MFTHETYQIGIIEVVTFEKRYGGLSGFDLLGGMYTPNPKRLRDWLSVPKSNGYESLHTTVLGPQNKWVEVQIRTERMDEVAEHGLAAHWRYKGIKSSTGGMVGLSLSVFDRRLKTI